MPDGIVSLIEAEELRRTRMQRLKADCEADLLTFIKAFWHILEPSEPFNSSWVVETMCDLLMAVTDGHHLRVILNVIPGSGKSLILCVFWPAWEWGPCNLPHLRYISASYNIDLPERDNDRFSRLVQHPEYQRLWGDRVKIRSAAKGLVDGCESLLYRPDPIEPPVRNLIGRQRRLAQELPSGQILAGRGVVGDVNPGARRRGLE